jgi:DNA-binding NarL/FixJ family response regulator
MSSDLLASALVRHKSWEASAISPEHLVHSLSTSVIDLVVIGADLNSKIGSGFELVQRICRMSPEVCVVMLLNHATRESIIHAFRSGVRGVFSRQQSMSEFLDCVEHVRRGFIWAGKHETDFLLEAFKSVPAPNVVTTTDSPALTPRELQVVQLAAKGKTNRVIAVELRLSEHTIKNYLFRAFEKLGVSSRVELLFYLTLRGHTFDPAKVDTATAMSRDGSVC